MNRATPKTAYRKPPSARPPLAKKSIVENSQPSVQNFIYMCFVFVFRRFVFAKTEIKIGIYVSALIVCSVIKDFRLMNSTNYFAHKNNLFNVYFVKFGWAWTLLASVPFVFMTAMVYTNGHPGKVKNHLSRIAIATVAWYTLTGLFDRIDSFTGSCSVTSIKTKPECKARKHEWLNGFDISGHTFILIYGLLVMMEEARVFDQWEKFHKELLEKTAAVKEDGGKLTQVVDLYEKLTPYIKINFVFMALLALLWEVMLLSTFLFFHTIMHKLLAAFCAIGVWFMTYQKWYRYKDAPWTPGLPGDGSIVY